jgi:hypothetical protein
MPFTPEFGGAFGQDLGSALASLIQQYGQKKEQRKQSQLLSQLLAGPGQQPVQGHQQAEGPSVLPVPLGQVLAQAQQAGLAPEQLRLIEQEYKRREDAARQQRKESREDIQNLQKESRADYKEILQEEGDYAKDIKGAYKTVPKIKKLLDKIINNADAAGPTNAIRPKPLLSTETRNLDSDINALINIASENFKGRVTNARLGFLAAEKPDITMTPESLKYTANKWLEDIHELEQEFNIARELKKRNNDRIPRNYQNIVAEELQLRRGPQEQQEFRSPEEPKNINAIETQRQQAPQVPGIPQPKTPGLIQPATQASQGEGLLGTLARVGTGAATSALGGLAEVPSALAGLASSIYRIGEPYKDLTEEQIKQLPEEQQRKIAEQRELTNQTDIFSKAQKVLPTAESIKEKAKEYLPEGYLEPKNETERFIYDVGEDLGTLLFPLGTPPKLLKAGGIALGGNIGKYLTKSIGGGEKAQNRAKIGSMIATAFGMQPFIKSKISAYYDSLKNSPAIESPIVTKNINQIVNNIERTHSRIGSPKVPSKKFLNEVIDDYKKNVSPAHRSVVRDVWAFKKDLGEYYKKAPKEAKPFLEEMRKAVNDSLKKNPEVPEFIKDTLTEVDQLNTGLVNSKKAQDFINDTFGHLPKKVFKYSAISASPVKGLIKGAGAYAGIKTLAGAARVGGVIKELFTNPAFRNAYAEFATAALKESKTGLIKSLNKLNKAAKK